MLFSDEEDDESFDEEFDFDESEDEEFESELESETEEELESEAEDLQSEVEEEQPEEEELAAAVPFEEEPAAEEEAPPPPQKKEPEPVVPQFVKASEVPVVVSIELGRTRISAEKLLSLQSGNILELGTSLEQGVILSVNGKPVGRGELLRLGEVTGVRITELS